MRNILVIYFIQCLSIYLIAQTKNLPCPGIQTVRYAGITYNTIQIGNQCWLKENLNVGEIISAKQNQTNNGIIEKYCYNDSTINCEKYGGLYQWDEVMQYSTIEKSKGLCPAGWHVPSLKEFQILGAAVNKDGNALKAAGLGTGTDTSGFSAILGGYRDNNGNFGVKDGTNFWSSTEANGSDARGFSLTENGSNLYYGNGKKKYGFSVRCEKDE
jgi:uncharacterized protein (TIGR02145 family)